MAEEKSDWEGFLKAIRKIEVPNPKKDSWKKKILLSTYIGYLLADGKKPSEDRLVSYYYEKYKEKVKERAEDQKKQYLSKISEVLNNPDFTSRVLSNIKEGDSGGATKEESEKKLDQKLEKALPDEASRKEVKDQIMKMIAEITRKLKEISEEASQKPSSEKGEESHKPRLKKRPPKKKRGRPPRVR